MSDKKVDRFIRNMPPVLKAASNPIVNALLDSWGKVHDDLAEQIQNTKAQLFVRTATGQYLDRIASGLGVSRPSALGLLDADFQGLVPVLSLEAKNIRKIFYEAMDIFWGPLFSRTNIQTTNFGPFNVSPGDQFNVSIDGGAFQNITALTQDIAVPGTATSDEIAAILSRVKGITPSIILDQATGHEFINIRTNTPGPRGSIQIQNCTMVSGTKLDFNLKKNRITDLSQRTTLWEITPKEIVIELPATIPTLRRTLKGSHHIHLDSTLEPPVAPTEGIWAGSFIYSPSGVSYTVTKKRAQILEALNQGSVYTKVTVDDASSIDTLTGKLIFGLGTDSEEQPVKFINKPNNSTILLDPGHVFAKTQPIGTYINVLAPSLQPAIPNLNGEDLAIYLTSPSNARSLVQNILSTLAAAGVKVTFVVLLPEYEYLVVNPYSGA